MAISNPITGVEGAAACTTNFATFIVNVYEWSASWTSDMFPAEVFGDTAKGHQNYRGMYSVKGSLRGVVPAVTFPHANLAPGTAAALLTLTERSTKTWSGNAHLNNIQVTVNRRTGLNEFSADFESDGDWAGA